MGISSALGSSALLPTGLGIRNFIINGDFKINQRQLSSRSTTGYLHDRWRLEYGGGSTTYSTQAFTLGNEISGFEPTNFAQFAVSGQSSASDYSVFQQMIEGVRTFAGQTVTVSFYARATSGTPKIALELTQYFGTGGSPSSAVNTNAGIVTLSTTWSRYSLTVALPSISGKTVGSVDDALIVQFWLSGGSNYSARTNSIGIQNSTFQIWGIQAEPNLQVTPLEIRPVPLELQMCQRYYYELRGWGGDDALCQGNYYATTQLWCVIQHPVQMRKGPTFSLANGYYSGYAIQLGNQAATAAQYTGTPQTSTVYFIFANARTHGVGGWIASADGIMYFNSEYFI